jgi:hypothetical protein
MLHKNENVYGKMGYSASASASRVTMQMQKKLRGINLFNANLRTSRVLTTQVYDMSLGLKSNTCNWPVTFSEPG